MVAGTKIKLKDQLGRVVRVGGDATKGAMIGCDLRWPNGSLVQESQVRNSTSGTSTGGSTGGLASTVWKLIRKVPSNLQKLVALAGVGLITRSSDGEWHQRSIVAGDGSNVENGDGASGSPKVSLDAVLDDLSDVDVAVATTGQILTKQSDGKWRGQTPSGGGGGGAMVYVGSAVVTGSAATSLTFSGLNIATDERYVIELAVKNASGSTSTVSMTYSADTTAANYAGQFVTGDNTVAGSRSNNASIFSVVAGECVMSQIIVRRDLDSLPRASLHNSRGVIGSIKAQYVEHF